MIETPDFSDNDMIYIEWSLFYELQPSLYIVIMKLSHRIRRNIYRIIPFAVIWFVTGWAFILVETAATGTLAPESPEVISLSWQIFIFASIAIILVGSFVGFVELVFVEKLFRHKGFIPKIIYKFSFYALMMLIVTLIT